MQSFLANAAPFAPLGLVWFALFLGFAYQLGRSIQLPTGRL